MPVTLPKAVFNYVVGFIDGFVNVLRWGILSVILFDCLYVTVKIKYNRWNFREQRFVSHLSNVSVVNGLHVVALGPSSGQGFSVERQEPCRGRSRGLREKWAYSEAFVPKFNQLWQPHFTGRREACGHFCFQQAWAWRVLNNYLPQRITQCFVISRQKLSPNQRCHNCEQEEPSLSKNH